mgnify:CR=1 FL=1
MSLDFFSSSRLSLRRSLLSVITEWLVLIFPFGLYATSFIDFLIATLDDSVDGFLSFDSFSAKLRALNEGVGGAYEVIDYRTGSISFSIIKEALVGWNLAVIAFLDSSSEDYLSRKVQPLPNFFMKLPRSGVRVRELDPELFLRS